MLVAGAPGDREDGAGVAWEGVGGGSRVEINKADGGVLGCAGDKEVWRYGGEGMVVDGGGEGKGGCGGKG